MMEDGFGQQVVAVARGWVGTPFHWGQSAKGIGCDCKGLIRGIARDLGRPEAETVAGATEDYRKVQPRRLMAGMAELFDPVTEARPGDLLLIQLGGKPMHLSVYCGEGRMVHTYAKGPGRVIEVPMGKAWWHAVNSIWRWRS